MVGWMDVRWRTYRPTRHTVTGSFFMAFLLLTYPETKSILMLLLVVKLFYMGDLWSCGCVLKRTERWTEGQQVVNFRRF